MYGVIQKYYDSGKVECEIILESESDFHFEADKSIFKETETHDLYIDWFKRYEDAEKFKNECLNS